MTITYCPNGDMIGSKAEMPATPGSIPAGTVFFQRDTGAAYVAVNEVGAAPTTLYWEQLGGLASDTILYVDNVAGHDTNPGTQTLPLLTLAEAFRRMPAVWTGVAEIHLAVTGVDYTLDPDPQTNTVLMQWGGPIGPLGTPLVIFGGYTNEVGTLTATANDATGNNLTTATIVGVDSLIGGALQRLTSSGGTVPGPLTAVPIRGNDGAGVVNAQASIGSIAIGDTFVAQRPAVVIRGTGGTEFDISCKDSPLVSATFVGIKVVCPVGAFFKINAAVIQCDTCEFNSTATNNFLFNGRLEGGLFVTNASPGLTAVRATAPVYLSGSSGANAWQVAVGAIGGHVTCKNIGIQAQMDGQFLPRSLEVLGSRVRCGAGSQSVAPVGSWGTATNPARIRNNTQAGALGIGLLVDGGGMLIAAATLHLDVFGCTSDGVRVDYGGLLYATTITTSDIRTSGANNGGFGMNVRNGGRAFVGTDANTAPQLTGNSGQAALDGVAVPGGWAAIVAAGAESNSRGSTIAVVD